MPRRPARVTQADIARAIRAVLQVGAGKIVIRPDGAIEIEPGESSPSTPVEKKPLRVL
jgi:hypothetical protein